MEIDIKEKQELVKILRRLKNNYEDNYRDHHSVLSEAFKPRINEELNYYSQDKERKNSIKQNERLINNIPRLALRTLSAGLMNGLTSPSRPWFSLKMNNKDLNEIQSVKRYLEEVRNSINLALEVSDTYLSLAKVYEDVGLFGQSCMAIFNDENNLIKTQVFDVGSFYVAEDKFGRCYKKTVDEVVKQFGLENVSIQTRNAYDRNDFDGIVEVNHLIIKNKNYIPESVNNHHKKYIEYYFEYGIASKDSVVEYPIENKVLAISGYDKMPVISPMWANSRNDYAENSPAMDCLFDAIGLQKNERLSFEAIEKKINPPMIADVKMRGLKKSLLPKSITYVDMEGNSNGFVPAIKVELRVDELEQKTLQSIERINSSLYKDLFMLITDIDKSGVTATEIQVRQQEKLLLLGSVLLRLNSTLLEPLINRIFDRLVEEDLLPEAPPEIEGQEFKVEYISILHQAQQSNSINGLDRLMTFIGSISEIYPEARDKINSTEMVDYYADSLGISPKIIRSDDEVNKIVQQRQEAQQRQEQMIMAEQMAKTSKDLSQSNTNDKNLLTDLESAYG